MANNSPHHIVRGAFMHPALGEAFTEAAWVLRSSKAQLLVKELRSIEADGIGWIDIEKVPASGSVKFHAQVEPELWSRIQEIADQAGVPISHVVRAAIANIITRAKVKVPTTH